jgi:hypothetical protein
LSSLVGRGLKYVDVECHHSLPLVLAAHNGIQIGGADARVQVLSVGVRVPSGASVGQGQAQWQQRLEQRQGRRGLRENRDDAASAGASVRAGGAGGVTRTTSTRRSTAQTLAACIVAEMAPLRSQTTANMWGQTPLMVGAVRWQPKQQYELRPDPSANRFEEHTDVAHSERSAEGAIDRDRIVRECADRILFLMVGMGDAGAGAGAAGEVHVYEVIANERTNQGSYVSDDGADDSRQFQQSRHEIVKRRHYKLSEGTMWTAEWATSSPLPSSHRMQQIGSHWPASGRISIGSSEVSSQHGHSSRPRSNSRGRGQASSAPSSRYLPSQLLDLETMEVVAPMPRAVGADVGIVGKGKGGRRCGGLDVFAQAFCDESNVLLSGCRDGSVWEWDTRAAVSASMQRVQREGAKGPGSAAYLQWRPSRPAAPSSVCCLQVLSSGHHVIVSSQDGSMRMIDRRTRTAIEAVGLPSQGKKDIRVGATHNPTAAARVLAEYRSGTNMTRRCRVALDPTETVLFAPQLAGRAGVGGARSSVAVWSVQEGQHSSIDQQTNIQQQHQSSHYQRPPSAVDICANAVGCWYQPSRMPPFLVCAATSNGLELLGT